MLILVSVVRSPGGSPPPYPRSPTHQPLHEYEEGGGQELAQLRSPRHQEHLKTNDLIFRSNPVFPSDSSLVGPFSDPSGVCQPSSPQPFQLGTAQSFSDEPARFSSDSPPIFRLSEVCSPVSGSDSQFTPLGSSSPTNKDDDTGAFRLSDLSEPGYKLDLQSGQLQIHLDLSTGDVINLTSLPEAGSPAEQDSTYVQPTYYEMSASVSGMDESETSGSIYPYFNTAGSLGATAASAPSNTSSSPYNLSNRYSELYSPSLYSQYYQTGYPSWAGAQTPGQQMWTFKEIVLKN